MARVKPGDCVSMEGEPGLWIVKSGGGRNGCELFRFGGQAWRYGVPESRLTRQESPCREYHRYYRREGQSRCHLCGAELGHQR